MVLIESMKGLGGITAPDFTLPATDGNTYSLRDFGDSKVVVVMFICNHCPYVKAVLPRINKLVSDYTDQGVAFFGINSNDAREYPEDSFEEMKKIPTNFIYLYDETQEVATDYHAACTPDIFVFDENRELKYHGRLDDNWKDEKQVKKQDLKEALDKILAGEEIPREEQIPSMGCSIKWRKE